MRRPTHEISPVDSVSLNSDLPVFQAPRQHARVAYQGSQPTDAVALSRESLGGLEEQGEDLCSNLLAAWA